VLGLGTRPAAAVQGPLTIVWIGALALPRHLPLSRAATRSHRQLWPLVARSGRRTRFRTEVLARFAASTSIARSRPSRDAYRALAENAVDFIWAIDLQGRWTYVNEALARRCGRTVQAMIGRPSRDVLPSHRRNPTRGC
jgi:PAS domain-containing protein